MCTLAQASDLLEYEHVTGTPHIHAMRRAVDAGQNHYLISHRDLLKWHAMMFQFGGQWRTNGAMITGTDFMPPNGAVIPMLMLDFSHDLEWWLGNSRDDPYRVLAYFHLKFSRIHPFSDGNGRIGRLLLNYLAAWYALPLVKIIDRTRYLDLLDANDESGLALFLEESSL